MIQRRCDLCGKPLSPEGHYQVRIDVTADPALPATTSAQLAATDFDREMARLMQQMKDMTAEQLQDQVHRRFDFAICPACQPGFLANPLGKPRRRRTARN